MQKIDYHTKNKPNDNSYTRLMDNMDLYSF